MADDKFPPAVQLNLRITFEEEATIQQASDALRIAPSALVELAVMQACLDLRMTLTDDEAPRLKPGFVWPFIPQRPDGESAKTRITAYLRAAIHPTAESAAWALRLSLPLFAIGATLRFVAIAKAINARRAKSEPGKFNQKLADIHVPYRFEEALKASRA